MRGDIDGDGKITQNDRNRINEHLGGTITLTDADSWCAKVTGNNEISVSDLVQRMQYLEGKTNNLTGIPTFADYYNNWTYHKADDLTGYWTAEIAINGLKTTSDAIVNIGNDEGIFYKSELSDGIIRFYATRPPIAEVSATITFKPGTGVITTSYESAKFHASTHSKDGADPITPESIGAVGYDVTQALTDDQKTKARQNIGAAPGGFGLGKETMVAIDDCNTAVFSGWYATDSPTMNTPNGKGESGVLCVSRRFDNRIYQEFHGINGGQYSRVFASRVTYGDNSTDLQWGPWEWLNPPMMLGVEYRTTERYLGEPVYKKLNANGIISWRPEYESEWRAEAGYANVEPAEGFSLSYPCQVFSSEHLIHVTGEICRNTASLTAGKYTHIGTLPVGYRPSVATYSVGHVESGGVIKTHGMLSIGGSGQILFRPDESFTSSPSYDEIHMNFTLFKS